MTKIETQVRWAAILVFLVMLFVAVLPYATNRSTHRTMLALRASIQQADLYESLLDRLRDAETGQRGYVITGRESFLEPYYLASNQLPEIQKELRNLGERSPDDKANIDWILRLTELKMAELEETIEIRRDKGFGATETLVNSARGKQYMDELRGLIDAHTQAAMRNQADLRDAMDYKLEKGFWLGMAVTVANIAVLAVLLLLMVRALRERGRTADLLRQTTDELSFSIDKTSLHNQQMTLTAEMLQALGSITSLAETSEVISTYCAKLLPGTSGVLFLYRNSRDMLEHQASWGLRAIAADPFEPKECWALQRGTFHVARNPGDLSCGHYLNEADNDVVRLCMPLVSQGQVIGILYVEDLAKDEQHLDAQRLVIERFAEQIALALVNVQLRDTLHRQSVTDPLTGLFNRRYMDETLKRELYRAHRKQLPLTVVVLDLDHFKHINDAHGHDAGDAVLCAVAKKIRQNIREGDLACRFGGEEMVLVLAECDLPSALARTESIRRGIAALRIDHGGHELSVTASFGIATYPEHGADAVTLLHAADQALYEAKRGGRNRAAAAHLPAS
jgi:diguanylate cyclase (GGDEF)-like protein